jgi:hypothetical protein
MRRVSSRLRAGAALLSLLATLVTPVVYAQESSPLDPPKAKIGPPIGISADAKIGPPVGAPTTASSQTSSDFLAMLWAWLLARIEPPTGTP